MLCPPFLQIKLPATMGARVSNNYIRSLKRTACPALKVNGWKMKFSFKMVPFRDGHIFRNNLLLVVGRLLGPERSLADAKNHANFCRFLESSTREGPEVHVVEDALDSERRMDVHRASFAFDVPWFW